MREGGKEEELFFVFSLAWVCLVVPVVYVLLFFFYHMYISFWLLCICCVYHILLI